MGKRDAMSEKMTTKQIKADLNNVRYYYARKDEFDKAFDCTGKSTILALVDKYNNAILTADARLYELYVCLYIKDNTHESAAYELNYSVDYIAKHSKRLLKFFQDKFAA